jgi:hypothetical protein
METGIYTPVYRKRKNTCLWGTKVGVWQYDLQPKHVKPDNARREGGFHMSYGVRYSPRKDDLFTPGKREGFFPSADLSEAALCAGMARLAYCRRDPQFEFDCGRIQQNLREVGFTQCEFFESKGTAAGKGVHGFLALRETGEKTAVVAFRGTDVQDLSDLRYDVDCELVAWSAGGRVHEGFAQALAQVQTSLAAALRSIGNCRRLYTGHSLGAALATLLASVEPPDALYTFGSPRVGDTTFVASLKATANYRYVDCCDLVTHLPPEIMGYAHFGDPYYIDRKRWVTFNPAAGVVSADQFRAQLKYVLKYAWRPGNVRWRRLADHAPVNYVWPLAAAQVERQIAA